METKTTSYLKLAGSLFFYFFLTARLIAQAPEDLPAEQRSRMLSLEISRLNEQAVQLRSRSRNADAEMRTTLSIEASVLEKQSVQKQIELYRLDYSIKQKNLAENKNKISVLQKSVTVKTNANHTRYLLDESAKNAKLAAELEEEGKAQTNPALALGVLDNADEKLNLALNQQVQAIDLLQQSSNRVAKTK